MTLGPLMIDVAATALSAEDRELLRHPAVGSVILFNRNFQDPGQLRALTSEIHALRSPALLVAVDHEGGDVLAPAEDEALLVHQVAPSELGAAQHDEHRKTPRLRVLPARHLGHHRSVIVLDHGCGGTDGPGRPGGPRADCLVKAPGCQLETPLPARSEADRAAVALPWPRPRGNAPG